ncbi:hypothetical protein [Kitasatospora kifunensis]|uniref:Uncharacterized protein n=1 Tax=Kitasatospora kifunensis TaxID=58351 RepID=A0A7W7W047_KITKI|nr:hypothetical protein [Kitasatospora kifunensis]MBB4928305.1 hypothetical protein [Kitasatospora kifunensis]
MFLERSAAEWAVLGIPERFYSVYALMPFPGWHKLAALGVLRPDEVERLRRIPGGTEPPLVMIAERAGRILADLPTG